MPLEPTQLQNISNALGGFSAGLQGNLPQFMQTQQNMQVQQQQMKAKEEEMAIERQKTMFVDAQAALRLAEAGDYESVVKLGMHRLQMLKQFQGVDPSDTQRLTQLAIAARNGSEEAAELLKGELQSAVQIGTAIGVLQPAQAEIIPQSSVSPTGQVAMRNPDGTMRLETLSGFTAPAQEGFEIITPQEAAQLGLPADKQFQRNKVTKQISQIGSGPAVQVNTGQATEGERTAGILANRLDFAQSQIDDILAASPETAAPGALPTVFGSIGLDYLARISNPAERQIIEAAQDDMLDAALTLGTGAAYTQEQFQAYKRSYFPQLGDDQKTIDAKARRLTNLLDAAYEKAGRGAPGTRRSAPAGVPEVGEIKDGYKFLGGDPASPASWEKQ